MNIQILALVQTQTNNVRGKEISHIIKINQIQNYAITYFFNILSFFGTKNFLQNFNEKDAGIIWSNR